VRLCARVRVRVCERAYPHERNRGRRPIGTPDGRRSDLAVPRVPPPPPTAAAAPTTTHECTGVRGAVGGGGGGGT